MRKPGRDGPYLRCPGIIKAMILVSFLVLPVFAGAQQYTYTQEQLDELLAPIALYPDPVLSQILMASTYPTEVSDADRFIRAYPDLTGDRLDQALLSQPWDPSVKSLCRYPDILSTMAEHIDQTTALGDAFLVQADQVMDTVQRLRRRAYDAGHLRSTSEQRIVFQDPYIVVEPVSPDIVYVPLYDPCWVYGPWWWPSCSRLWFWYPGIGISGAFIFGRPVHIGHHGHWSGFRWRSHSIYVDPQRTIEFNRVPPTRAYSGQHNWVHDTAHRRGVAYRNPSAVTGAPRPGPDTRTGYRGFPAARPGVEAPLPASPRAPSGRAPGTIERPSGPAPSGAARPRTEAPAPRQGRVQTPAPALAAPSGATRPGSSTPPASQTGTVRTPAVPSPAPTTVSAPPGRTGALAAPPVGSPHARQESERGRSSLRSSPGTAPRSPAPAATRTPAPAAPAPRIQPAPHAAPHAAPAAPPPHAAPPAHPGGGQREHR